MDLNRKICTKGTFKHLHWQQSTNPINLNHWAQHFSSFAALEGMAILSNGSQIRQYRSLETLENKEHSEGLYNMNIFNSMNINSRLLFEQPAVGGRNFVDCQGIKFAC